MRWIPVFVLGSLLTGCSGQVAMPGSSTRSDIEELQRRVIELQRRAAVSEVEIRELKAEIARLRQPASTKKSKPKVSQPLPDRTPKPLPPVGTIEAADLPPSPPPPAAPVVTQAADDLSPPTPASAQAQSLYDEGYTLYHQGRYLEAERVFRQFLSTYRDNELSDNAWYWIGESRWARKDVEGALQAFQETLESYPRGNKTPDALLKMGQCLERLGDVPSAKEAYRQLVDRYPATAAATAAEERLTELG